MTAIAITPIAGLPEISPGTDLVATIAALHVFEPGDIVVVSQKVISKAEGAIVDLSTVQPTKRARELADGRDPRLVQVVLDQSTRLLREHPVLIAETHHGFVCANAGVDQSNTGRQGVAILLPSNPDRSANELREGLSRLAGGRIGVIVADSFGRAWRVGQCDVAIGCSGIAPLSDLRGTTDRDDRTLTATLVATADQLAAAADLGRTKSSGDAAVVIRGLSHLTTGEHGDGATALVREQSSDLFR